MGSPGLTMVKLNIFSVQKSAAEILLGLKRADCVLKVLTTHQSSLKTYGLVSAKKGRVSFKREECNSEKLVNIIKYVPKDSLKIVWAHCGSKVLSKNNGVYLVKLTFFFQFKNEPREIFVWLKRVDCGLFLKFCRFCCVMASVLSFHHTESRV